MYIKVVFDKKLLDVDIIFNIENAIVDDMYFVFCFMRGIWVFIKYSDVFEIYFTKTFEPVYDHIPNNSDF